MVYIIITGLFVWGIVLLFGVRAGQAAARPWPEHPARVGDSCPETGRPIRKAGPPA